MEADGHLVAVLPESSLHSEKDSEAWETVRRRFSVSIVHRNTRRCFPGCVATTSLVHLIRSTHQKSGKPAPADMDGVNGALTRMESRFRWRYTEEACRCISQSRARMERASLIYSTELRDGRVDVAARGHFIPLVICCEVRPYCFQGSECRRKSKMAVYTGRVAIVLSDCVIALRCANQHEAGNAPPFAGEMGGCRVHFSWHLRALHNTRKDNGPYEETWVLGDGQRRHEKTIIAVSEKQTRPIAIPRMTESPRGPLV